MSHFCFIKIQVGGRLEGCGRARLKTRDLCCPEHWAQVPKALKQRLVDAGKLRSFTEQRRATILAADAVAEFISQQKIQLAPVTPLEQEHKTVIRPDSIIRSSDAPAVDRNTKLIL